MNEKRAKPAGGSCALLSCEVCCKEIPQSEALNAEAADYIYHFCGPQCFARFSAARVPDRGEISVFQVRLRCEAEPKIGCGLRAKPVLQDLERVPGIREAWLSRDGNLIAVVMTATGSGTKVANAARAVFRKHRIAVEALRGEQFAKALGDFAVRSTWHRGADVDRLSEEEARIIAARLVARLRARAALPELRANVLEMALAEACAHELIRNPTQSVAARKRRLASAVLAAARERLDAPAYAAFADAVRLGHRPLPAER
ncbi:MAG: DUF3330 domain-containing protein [Betaproteobacteria bacterium]|nr:DUF3330 domain-containing protein [Betaproteobacteria bacterium]